MAAITPSLASLAKPFLGQPVEICIVTANLRETLTGLVRLGIGPFKIYHSTPENVTEQTFRSVVNNQSIKSSALGLD